MECLILIYLANAVLDVAYGQLLIDLSTLKGCLLKLPGEQLTTSGYVGVSDYFFSRYGPSVDGT